MTTLTNLMNIIMPHLEELWNTIGNDDLLINVSIDDAWDNGILLTFATYNGCEHDMNDTYQMRALIGDKGKIIYENAINGEDFRDYVEEHGISKKIYDKIMHNRHVVEADYENTGGHCITYYGKFDTGEYFAFGLGSFAIYDADYGITFTQEFFEETDGDTYEWENEHIIEIFDEDEVLDYVNQTHALLKERR